MMYDVIIVGAGIGGLSAGLELASNNKKVLILEKNNLPGGNVTTIKKGRFEFDVGLTDFYDFGTDEKKGSVRNILEKYDIFPEVISVPYDFKIIVNDTKEEFLMKGEIEDFIVELEKFKNGSFDSLKEFLKVIKQINEGFKELKKGNEDLEDYPLFLKYLDYNVMDALVSLKMPKETIHRLSFLWVYLGSPLDKLSFIDFALFMYKLIFKKISVLKNKNINLIFDMVKRYEELGGKIYYRSLVTNIKDEGDFKVVSTSDGKEYKAKDIICNVSKRYVYQNLVLEDEEVNQLENARTVAPSAFMVCLGLNKDCKSLGLEHYRYYHFGVMNSTLNVKKMTDFFHYTWDATIPNVVNEMASPKNTSILILSTTYFSDVFAKVNKENYQAMKEKIANDLISQFEKATKIDVKEYIEEVCIITPLNIASYTNSPNGSIMGMARKSYDNAIHRVISYQNEIIPNMYFVGASSIFGGGIDNAIYSGYYMAKKILESGENDGE